MCAHIKPSDAPAEIDRLTHVYDVTRDVMKDDVSLISTGAFM